MDAAAERRTSNVFTGAIVGERIESVLLLPLSVPMLSDNVGPVDGCTLML